MQRPETQRAVGGMTIEQSDMRPSLTLRAASAALSRSDRARTRSESLPRFEATV